VGARPDVALVDADLAPAQLRAVVGKADLLITSRFHGMITGLASATPTVVVGWGHKYAEVLAQFDGEHLALDYSALRSPEEVRELVVEAWADRTAIRARFADCLQAAQASAARNFDVLVEHGAAR
jgi:polysaccharide pyruvyl transferase WcaK-like protein